ncbi:kinase-like domain-containing protein [Ampelomyces quisqualis]|uniref:non-specific serine/threonine protein kinase n=1 Tax=Ampelomyces quisqualis TaxID=50730 RepID=A0A6A5QSR2_AMPQU|nr:kinase-like domain-containing protein [Ampelomyces quisqualis]
MSARFSYTPVAHVVQGEGGNNNRGIIVVRHNVTGKLYIEKRVGRSTIARGEIHREIRIMRQCRNHPHMVNIIDYYLDIRRFDYGSVFMQQGELGSVDALIGRYRSRRQYLVDEGFAWKVLYDEAMGIAYLWTGQDDAAVREHAALGEVVPRKSGWSPVIHRDLKPSNVFMAWRDKPAYPVNPHPVMLIGDFRSAVTDEDILDDAVPPMDHRFASPEFPEYKRPNPAELPKYVWRGWQMWIQDREKDVEKLPEWALGG